MVNSLLASCSTQVRQAGEIGTGSMRDTPPGSLSPENDRKGRGFSQMGQRTKGCGFEDLEWIEEAPKGLRFT